MERLPVWLMRQAGRYLPEYRAIRERYDLLTMMKTPELAAEVTLQPVRRFGVDAAILFADILLPLEPLGFRISFTEGEGPRIEAPLRQVEELARLRPVEPREDLAFVLETIRQVRSELGERVPLIGFAGAPFTLACYAVEGQGSRDFALAKALMWGDPPFFHRLMEILTETTVAYLLAQVEAGAAAVQLFDSWAGTLHPDDYRHFVLPYSRTVLERLAQTGVPVIHFAMGTSSYLETVAEAGGDVLSIDWRIRLTEARLRTGGRFALQGNLDPAVLLTSRSVVVRKTEELLHAWGGLPGLVVNLGHGVDRRTPPDHVAAFVDTVHSFVPAGDRP